MATDYGVFSTIVPTAASIIAATAAIAVSFKGRAKWEPVQEDIPDGGQRIAGLLSALTIALLWYWFSFGGNGNAETLTTIAACFGVAALTSLVIYGLLVGIYVYERVEAVDENPEHAVTKKIIGGFCLEAEAKKMRTEHKLTIQDLLAGSKYNVDKIWTRPCRAFAKVAFQLSYIGLVYFGTTALAAAAIVISGASAPETQKLSGTLDAWIKEAEVARSAKTIQSGSPLPTNLIAARTAFETSWKNESLPARRKLDKKKVSKGLSYLNRIYRIQENDSPTQKNALMWANIAIQHFEEMQDRELLLEALLDKAAVFLDLGQLANNNKDDFGKLATEGDAVMTRAFSLANEASKPEVYRVASRFYYSLARPKSFRLSDSWDNNYLLLAYSRIEIAYKLAPGDIRNANQMARTTIKVSKNPPQNQDVVWAQKLRDAKDAMKRAWDQQNTQLTDVDSRLSPLSVLGTVTLETIEREWSNTPVKNQVERTQAMIAELDSDGLAPLREAEAFLNNAVLKRSYGFDIYYDIARAQAVKTALARSIGSKHANLEFDEVKANLARAREVATSAQIDAAMKDFEQDRIFTQLGKNEQLALVQQWKVASK